MSYQRSFLIGFGWNGSLKVVSKVISAIKLAILARLLSPTDYGLFSLVLVSISLIEVFTESGINTILIQSDKKLEQYVDTAWIFSIARGIIIFSVMIVLSKAMPWFYHEPKLFSLIFFASVIPLIRGFINPAIIGFYKELDFRKDTYYRFSLVIVDFVAAVFFGLILKNTFALILPMFFSAIADVIISFRFTAIRPQFRFDKQIFQEIFAQSKWLNNITILDYLNKNVDNLIVGRMLGTGDLGMYQSGFSVSQSATSELGLSVIHASFPIYSRMTEDKTRLKRAFLKVASTFCLFLLIPTVLFILFPNVVASIQFGQKWSGIAVILPLLALAGYVQGFLNIASTVFTAQKKFHYLTISLGIMLVTLVTGLFILIPSYGLLGAAYSVLIAKVVTVPFYCFFLYKTLHVTKSA